MNNPIVNKNITAFLDGVDSVEKVSNAIHTTEG
jgi:hypothetical protein